MFTYKNSGDVLYLKAHKVNSFCKKKSFITTNTVIFMFLIN